jgi:hypothetical protein
MTDTPIAMMDAAQAGARLAQLQGNAEWAARLLKGDAAARNEFDQLGYKAAGLDAPSSPAAASAKAALDRFTADPGIAERLLRGDAAVSRQFAELSRAAADSDGHDVLADALTGAHTRSGQLIETTFGKQLTSRGTMAAIDGLREVGISDGAIAEAFSGLSVETGRPYDAATVARARALRAVRMGDREWTSRLMAGGLAEKRELMLMNIITAGAAA